MTGIMTPEQIVVVRRRLAGKIGYTDALGLAESHEALRAELERVYSLDAILELLDRHYPESVFPTLPDTDTRDPGPRIISLLRLVARMREKLASIVLPPDHLDMGVPADIVEDWDRIQEIALAALAPHLAAPVETKGL